MRDEASPVISRSREPNRVLPVETEFVGVPEPAAMPTRRAISFGPFRVLPAQQLLVIRPFVAAVVPWRS
jgi:hypothetical protein